MKILITGKNSYVGNSFKKFVNYKNEHQVDEIGVRNNNWKSYSFKGYDVIIHLASLVHKNERKYTLNDYEEVNVKLTMDIAKKAIEEGIKKFVFISTMAVYGKVKTINSQTLLNPISKYGITKLKAENELKSITKNSLMSLTIFRPPMIYGLGAKGNASIIENLSRYFNFFPETFNRKSFISIENLCKKLYGDIKCHESKIIHPQDPKLQTTYNLFRYYREILQKNAHPLIFIGYLLKKITFIGFINKVFGDSYYDFND